MPYSSIDQYLAEQPEETREKLMAIRKLLKELVPEGEECISYSMPAIRTSKVLVYYAGCAHHIGFYPTPGPIEAYRDQLKPYHTSKGAVQFPLKQDLPLDLIRKMVLYRKNEVERQ
jgi:uncharacterized protein YdhG (YjbR/CyaY superfamily)